MPFDLIEEIKLVLKDQGFYPYIKVTSDLLPSPLLNSGTSKSKVAGLLQALLNVIGEDDDAAHHDTGDEGSTAGSLSGDKSDMSEEESEDDKCLGYDVQ